MAKVARWMDNERPSLRYTCVRLYALNELRTAESATLRTLGNLGGCAGRPFRGPAFNQWCIRHLSIPPASTCSHPSTGQTDVHSDFHGQQVRQAALGSQSRPAGFRPVPWSLPRVSTEHSRPERAVMSAMSAVGAAGAAKAQKRRCLLPACLHRSTSSCNACKPACTPVDPDSGV